jgi:hypothetical protein
MENDDGPIKQLKFAHFESCEIVVVIAIIAFLPLQFHSLLYLLSAVRCSRCRHDDPKSPT